MEIFFTIAVIVGILWLVYGFAMFDRLVRWEYQHHRDHWDADGRPDGFFWRAPECKLGSGDIAKKRLSFRWLLRTPVWVRGSDYCSSALLRLRIVVLVWNASIIGLVLWRVF